MTVRAGAFLRQENDYLSFVAFRNFDFHLLAFHDVLTEEWKKQMIRSSG